MRYSSVAVLAMLSVAAADIAFRFGIFAGASNGGTLVVLSLNVLSIGLILILLSRRAWLDNLPKSGRYACGALLAWGVITLVRGMFQAQDYWAWKTIATDHLFMFLVPLAIVIGLDIKLFQRVPRAVILALFPLAVLLLPLSFSFDSELFARAAMPVCFVVLLLPFLAKKYWIPVIAVASISVAIDPTYRANSIRILLAATVALLWLSRIGLRAKLLNAAATVLFIIPLVFLCLGLAGKFNVFRDGISLDTFVTVVEGGKARDSSLSADTRTFLYREVLTSMEKRRASFLVGQGAGTGYESRFFASSIIAESGRGGSEVGFLNVLLFSGVIGVLLYLACIFTAVYLAINRSRNDLCRMLGIFLALRWVLFFTEDIPKLDLNMFFVWVSIGLCMSKSFRALTNLEIKSFLAGQPRELVNQ